MEPVFKYTGQTPGLLPRSMSGALPGALIWSLLGAGAGRYIASPILQKLFPEIDEERANRTSMVLGGLAGAIPGSYLMYKNWQLAGGPKGLIGGLENIKTPPWVGRKPKPKSKPTMGPPVPPTLLAGLEKDSAVKSQGLSKEAYGGLPTRRPVSAAWLQPSIPMGTAQSTLEIAVSSGTLGVYDAANISQILHEARPQGSGLISPSSIARAAVSYGVGALAGRALGAVANTIFGSFSSGEQKNLARGFGIGNLLFDTLGRLASR